MRVPLSKNETVQVERLKTIDRFAGLNDEILGELAQRGHISQHKKGDQLFFEGDDCECLYLIVNGAVKIAKSLESGKELIVDILQEGDTVGEVALLDNFPYPAGAVVHSDAAEIYCLPAVDYLALLERFPALSRATIRDLAGRLRHINRRMKDVSGGNVEYRIAHLLLTLGDRVGRKDGSHVIIDLPMTRQEIADMVGTTIETTIRIMSRWGKEGIVETRKEGFVIQDVDKLQSIGEASL